MWLDGIRGIAALAVVLTHVRGFYFAEWSMLDVGERNLVNAGLFFLTRLGREAVVVFFVLSGFLVGGGALSRVAQGSWSLRSYAADRISRMYVVLVPALLLTAGCDALRGEWNEARNGVAATFTNLSFVQGFFGPAYGSNSPLWSLAYEGWFYVLFALVLWSGRSLLQGRRLKFLIGLVLLAVLLGGMWTYGRAILVMLPTWLAGALVAEARRRGWLTLRLTTVPMAVFAMTIVWSNTRWDLCGDYGVAVGTLVLLACLPIDDHAPTVSSRAFSGLAALSFSLYATHYPLVGLLQTRFFPLRSPHAGLCEWLTVMGLTLIIVTFAVVFYWTFERHTTAIRAWLRGQLSRTAVAH